MANDPEELAAGKRVMTYHEEQVRKQIEIVAAEGIPSTPLGIEPKPVGTAALDAEREMGAAMRAAGIKHMTR